MFLVVNNMAVTIFLQLWNIFKDGITVRRLRCFYHLLPNGLL